LRYAGKFNTTSLLESKADQGVSLGGALPPTQRNSLGLIGLGKEMKNCTICNSTFDPATVTLKDPAVEVGHILAQEKYGDAGTVCMPCLANRGRLAMMYDPDLQY